MRYQAVLFDLDGVLIFSKEVWFHLLNATAAHFGCEPVSRERFEETWGQGVQADRELFYPHRSLEEIEAFYNAHFIDHIAYIEVNPDAAEVLQVLARNGVPSAVVTNTPAPAARDILAKAGLPAMEIVGGTDVPHPKPAPDMVLEALDRLGVEPASAVMVGDTRFDREAAAAAGVRFAGYETEGEITLARLSDILTHVDG